MSRSSAATASTCASTASTASTSATSGSCNGALRASRTRSTTAGRKQNPKHVRPVIGVYADIADDYDIISLDGRVLGKGHCGVVRECVHRASRRSFAVKSVDKSKITRLDHLQREVFLLANIDHRNILKMVDCYEDADFVHIITQKYTGGELFDEIVNNTNSYGCFSERRARPIIQSLLEAVAYLHDNGVVHRDIKPENILFESKDEQNIRLIDFGLSRRHERGEGPMTNPVGTAYYMSPELLKGKYDKSTDLWSVGVVAYILLCGRPPFNGATDAKIRKASRGGKLRFDRGAAWMNKSDDAMEFVRGLLRKDPRKRFTAREALAHPWITAAANQEAANS